MISLLSDFTNAWFFLILFNLLSLYNITANYFLFTKEKINVSLFKLSLTVIISLIIIDLFAVFVYLEIISYIFYFFSFPIVFCRIYRYIFKLKGAPWPRINVVKFWRDIGSAFLVSGIVSSFLAGLYFTIKLSTNVALHDEFSGYYFALYTVAYIFPGLVYFLYELHNVSKHAFSRDMIGAGMSKLGLTPREQDVALQIINGMKYDDIADMLCISLTVVKKHAYNTFRKADVQNSRQLMQKLLT
ncbi:MAG: hypothetical protein JW904_01320 [Spirochaetales bacterium]|nr:hypothetical protein [Spirochaetales bacterium]